MSFFPQTTIKSDGADFAQQNRECGTFTGVIKAIRPIQSKSNSTVFGVVELEVEGKPGVFQDYLNFNPAKAEQSMGYLVSHCKAAIESSGATVSEGEKTMQWVEDSYQKLHSNKAKLTFQQSMNAQGQVSINFIPATSVQTAGF